CQLFPAHAVSGGAIGDAPGYPGLERERGDGDRSVPRDLLNALSSTLFEGHLAPGTHKEHHSSFTELSLPAYPIEGITPSCCIMPRASNCPHCSTIFPFAMREMFIP